MVRSNDRPDMTLDVYRGRKTTTQQLRVHLSFLRCWVYFVTFILFDGKSWIKNCTARHVVKAKIYGALYNQSSSVAFDIKSSYWSAPKSS